MFIFRFDKAIFLRLIIHDRAFNINYIEQFPLNKHKESHVVAKKLIPRNKITQHKVNLYIVLVFFKKVCFSDCAGIFSQYLFSTKLCQTVYILRWLFLI